MSPEPRVQELIKQLLNLQERDLELDRLQADLLAIPKEIAVIQQQSIAEQAALEESKKELTQLQIQRKEKEVDLESKEGEIRKHTTELNIIKSNDAYRAMLGEIEKVKQEKSVLEDTVLQLLDRVDQAQRSWKEREASTKAAEGGHQQRIGELEAKQKSLEEQKTQKQKERDDLTATYAKSSLERYQRLRDGKKGAVVVPLKNEQCSGCHMRISPNLVNEVKRGQEIMVCEHCSRIVYLEEAKVV